MRNEVEMLLKNHEEAKLMVATNVVKEAKQLLVLLGMEHLLTASTATIQVKEVEKIVEVEKIIEVEKVVEKVVEVSSKKDLAKIDKLTAELKAQKDANKEAKKMITQLQNKIKKMEAATVKAPVPKTPVVNKPVDSKITAINISNDMKILDRTDSYIFGTYKGVAFQAATKIDGTVVYNKNKFALKAEIEDILVQNKLINEVRPNRDACRIESEKLGVCHKIDDYTYQGFIFIGEMNHCFTWRVNKNEVPASMIIKNKIKNPRLSYGACNNAAIIAKISAIVEKHKQLEEEHNAAVYQSTNNIIVDSDKIEREQNAIVDNVELLRQQMLQNTAPELTPIKPLTATNSAPSFNVDGINFELFND